MANALKLDGGFRANLLSAGAFCIPSRSWANRIVCSFFQTSLPADYLRIIHKVNLLLCHQYFCCFPCKHNQHAAHFCLNLRAVDKHLVMPASVDRRHWTFLVLRKRKLFSRAWESSMCDWVPSREGGNATPLQDANRTSSSRRLVSYFIHVFIYLSIYLSSLRALGVRVLHKGVV